jgi:hypothetical protein
MYYSTGIVQYLVSGKARSAQHPKIRRLFPANEDFCRQLRQFLTNRPSKRIELTVIAFLIYAKLEILKNDHIYREIS